MTVGGWTLANPAGLWWCLLALPIVALHVLRPRRVQAQVAAVFLWRRVATPVTAASPWQRLTPSWLLVAQVLTALLLGLLLAQPVRLTDELLAEHTVFVIDASGSMQATDGSPDRLESARVEARELREQIPVGGRASLVVAGADARAVVTNSADADAFDAALRAIEPADGAGDIAGAFALAAGLDTGDVDTSVVFVSDGGIGDADVRAAPVGTRYVPVGSSATNRAITQLSVEPAQSGLLARVTVAHFGGPPATQTVRVDVDGVTVVTEQVELEAGGIANLALPVPAGEMIEAFLEGEDALALDNRAVATVARRPSVDVLWVGPDNPFIAAALEASPGVEVTRLDTFPPSSGGSSPDEGSSDDGSPDEGSSDESPVDESPVDDPLGIGPEIDLVVADRVAVPASLDVPLLAIAPPGGANEITVDGSVENPILTLVRSDVPLVQDLDFSGVFVAEAQRLAVPPGGEVVLGAEGAPLLVSLSDPVPTLYVAFELGSSTLPLELAFPVLVDRAIADLTNLVTPPARLVVGADLPVDPRRAVTITAPDGTSTRIPAGSSYPTAAEVGFWRVTQEPFGEADADAGGAGAEPTTLLVAVGPDRRESSIAPAPDLAFEEAFETTGGTAERGQIPFLVPIVVALLALLALEYWLADRRRGVGARQWRVATAVRIAVALALLGVLLAPSVERRADGVATLFMIDASDSMTPAGRAAAVDVVRSALADQPEGTRAGIVVFGNDARLETLVSGDPAFDGVQVQVDPGGTDLSAAIRLGAAALPEDARRRVVLISDGRSTTGDATAEAERLADAEIPLDVVVIDPTSGSDLAVAGVDVPNLARAGERVDVDVRIVAPSAIEAEVTIRRDGEEVDRRIVELDAGENTVRFTDVADSDGVLRYQVEIEAAGDIVDANDLGYAAVPVEGADRVLLVEGQADRGAGLAAALEAGGLPVDVVDAASLPSIDELTRYTSVVLVDVDRRDLADGQVADLTAAVRDLGRGMVVIGGTHAYALGGYRDSDLEQILPVISEITDPLRRQTVAEVLAIDSSGSMAACHCDEEGQNGLGGGNRIGGGVSKTAIARTAAARAIAALEATDEVGVLTMDANDRWVIDLQASPPQEVIDEGLAEVVPNGPTFIDTGLLTAAEQLRESDASLKHIILFSDGFTEPGAMAEMTQQAADLLAEGITVSVVATGEGAADDLRPIAEAGGGRYYPGRNLEEIPDLIVQEAVLASRDFVNEGDFLPLISSNRDVVAGLQSSPPLQGYVATTARPTATVDLRIGPDEDPLLASWQAGLGRVTAWTSDGGERWAAPWDGWDGGPDFWTAVVKDTFPIAGEGAGVGARIVDGQLQIELEGDDDWEEDASATVRVAGPDGSSTEVPLERIDGTRFGATVPVEEAGTYAIGAVVADGDETVWSGVGLTTRSYPAEYAPRPVERDQLEALADLTGGRVDPSPSELFSATGTTPGSRRFELVPWLLLFAALAWPVAVAVSRLAWRRGALAVGAARATTTVSELRARLPKMTDPATTRGPARDREAGRPPDPNERAIVSPGSPSPREPVAVAPPAGDEAAPRVEARARPDQRVAPSATGDDSSSPSEPGTGSDPDGDGDGASSTLSELLARKRRRG